MKKNKKVNENKRRKNINDEDKLSKGIDILDKHKIKEELQRQERKGKTVKEYSEDINKKKKIKSGIKSFIVCIVVVIIFLLIYVVYEYGPFVGISLNKNKVLDDYKKIDVVTTDQDIYKEYDSQLLIYSNQIVKTYDANSKVTSEYKLSEAFNPSIYVNGSYMVIANKIKGIIYLFENKVEILDKKIDGTIECVYIDDDGNIAVEYSTSGIKKIIGVFNKKGDNIYNAYLDSNAVIDIKILNSAKKLIVAQLISNSYTVGVSIKDIDGTKTSDNIKEIVKIDNSMLYNLTINAGNIIMLFDDKIINYDMNTQTTNTIKSFDNEQISFVDVLNNYYFSIKAKQNTDNDVNTKYLCDSNGFDGRSIGSFEIENLPKYERTGKLITTLVFQDKIQVINKWGMNIKTLDVSFPPKDIVIFNNEKSIALIYLNKVYIVNI